MRGSNDMRVAHEMKFLEELEEGRRVFGIHKNITKTCFLSRTPSSELYATRI
jgi:hypothetical protein